MRKEKTNNHFLKRKTMRTFILTIVISVLFMLSSIKYSKAQLPPNDTAYHLAFCDSFSDNSLNTTLWRQNMPWNQSVGDSVVLTCSPTATVDAGYNRFYLNTTSYPPDTLNCKITGGNLNLYCRKETAGTPYHGEWWTFPACTGSDPDLATKCNGDGGQCGLYIPNQCWHKGTKQFKYTGSMIETKYKFRYGYFEIRFKLPLDTLTGPRHYSNSVNFWLYEADAATVNWSEIDIMELNGDNRVYASAIHYSHYPYVATSVGDTSTSQANYYNPISDNAWHIASVLWTGDDIVFYMDGVQTHNIRNLKIRPDSLLPMPLIIDLGSPGTNHCLRFDANSVLPYNYQVDYVKVWQLNNGCSKTNKTFCSDFNPDGYGRIYKSVAMDGASCVDAITNKYYSDILGTNYVTLDQGFSVDGNSTVLIDAQGCTSTTQSHAPPPIEMPPSAGYTQGHFPE